jgi:hypothetical protein
MYQAPRSYIFFILFCGKTQTYSLQASYALEREGQQLLLLAAPSLLQQPVQVLRRGPGQPPVLERRFLL